MAIYNKPDESVFASNAKQGEVNNFPDIGRGWGISFDQTGGIPPMEWFNFLFKRTDEKFGYLFQRGLSEWSETQEYPIGALVQYKNSTYKAKRANTNKKPDQADSLDWQRWGFTQSELKSATLTESGITQLLTSINSNDETKSATPKSVKMAYDKGVEAKTAADNAQRTANDGVSKANNAQLSANAANNNANGRVSKGGDAINGTLFIDGIKSGGFASGLVIRNKAGGQNTSGFIDFFQSDNVPRSSMWFRDAGNNSTQIDFLNTPEGADWNIDSRQGVFTISSAGNLWSKSYGWLHDHFAKQGDINNVWNELNNTYRKNRFRHQHYPHHYGGAEVFDIPVADNGVMRVIVMNVTINGYARVNLPEAYNGSCMVQATDVGGGRKVVGANIQNGNVVEIHAAGEVGLNILAIGWYGW
jgi:probable tail fiber protein (fragment)|nr:MAG TPA: Baseplate structural protein [Caudoviricetes sp.]DAW61773.1 MAG TPA: Baseplate structural protein [Caudoviricetes sp.]